MSLDSNYRDSSVRQPLSSYDALSFQPLSKKTNLKSTDNTQKTSTVSIPVIKASHELVVNSQSKEHRISKNNNINGEKSDACPNIGVRPEILRFFL